MRENTTVFIKMPLIYLSNESWQWALNDLVTDCVRVLRNYRISKTDCITFIINIIIRSIHTFTYNKGLN